MAGWERTGTDDAPVWTMDFPHRRGLVVRCTVPSLRAEVLGRKVGPLLAAGLDTELRALLALAEVFADDSLLSWNLQWGGQVRPATAEGFVRVDRVLIEEILLAWTELWVPAPLEPEPPAEPESEFDAELAALSIDLPDPDSGEDTAAAELVTADA